MPNPPNPNDSNEAVKPDAEFLPRPWSGFRDEINETVSRYVELERYALLSTGAIWTWLAGTTNADWNPLLKWLPLGLNMFFCLRAIGLMRRTHEISKYLKSAEEYYRITGDLALESRYQWVNFKTFTMVLFWVLLIGATAALPHFYELNESNRGVVVIPLG